MKAIDYSKYDGVEEVGAYNDGYMDGRRARGEAMNAYAKKIGASVNVLRIMEVVPAQAEDGVEP